MLVLVLRPPDGPTGTYRSSSTLSNRLVHAFDTGHPNQFLRLKDKNLSLERPLCTGLGYPHHRTTGSSMACGLCGTLDEGLSDSPTSSIILVLNC
ncbi:hypothetical protein VTN31DRAFT_1548 [Thermomyces dupontii]|uniref:uncharacterized protein n=1 Tax=Talaromyces thermophilus TaxID=28565 RepID=UPI00374345B8